MWEGGPISYQPRPDPSFPRFAGTRDRAPHVAFAHLGLLPRHGDQEGIQGLRANAEFAHNAPLAAIHLRHLIGSELGVNSWILL